MENPKENASSLFEGTLTGRLIKETPMMDAIMNWGRVLPRYMRENVTALVEKPVLLGVDFAKVEDRVVAQLVSFKDGKLVARPIRAGDMIQGKRADFVVADDLTDDDSWIDIYETLPIVVGGRGHGKSVKHLGKIKSMFEIFDEIPVPEQPEPEEPMKQNGRSASYLKHDKTKKHHGMRRHGY